MSPQCHVTKDIELRAEPKMALLALQTTLGDFAKQEETESPEETYADEEGNCPLYLVTTYPDFDLSGSRTWDLKGGRHIGLMFFHSSSLPAYPSCHGHRSPQRRENGHLVLKMYLIKMLSRTRIIQDNKLVKEQKQKNVDRVEIRTRELRHRDPRPYHQATASLEIIHRNVNT